MMAQKVLPTFIILQSYYNYKYLRLDKDNPKQANSLVYDGDYSYGLETRFEVVHSTEAEGLVHIRSLSNNKFWEYGLLAEKKLWITATAEKSEENQSYPSCTLFEPVFSDPDHNNLIRLRHVNTGYYVTASYNNPARHYGDRYAFLQLEDVAKGSTNQAYNDVLNVIDWEENKEMKILWGVEMMAQSRLPTTIVLQSSNNHRYLHLDKDNPNEYNALRFDGDYSYGLETRFEVVHSTEAEGLVHIRSLRNNKFWENTGVSDYITATAEKVEEDPSNPCCTLFQPIFPDPDDNSVIRLRHVHSNHYVIALYDASVMNGSLKLKYVVEGVKVEEVVDVFKVLDWQSIVMLPDRIRIKGDNGKYLKAFEDGFMDYNYDLAKSELDFEYDVSPSRDGGILLKSVKYGKYWTLDAKDSWIMANGAHSPTDHATDTVFIATKLGENNNIIALRSLSSGEFCKRLSKGYKNNCLCSSLKYTDSEHPMVIEEPVLSRTIDNVDYHLNDARIYNKRNVALTKEEAVNRKPHADDTSKNTLVQKVTNRREWTASVSASLTVTAHINVGIPLVSEVGIESSYHISGSYEWGKSTEEIVEVGSEYTVTVPARSRVKTSLMATRGSCIIPYSYTQRDVLENQFVKIYRKHDGLYKGQNAYDYRYESVQLTLEGTDPEDKMEDVIKNLGQDGDTSKKRPRTST